MVSRGLYCSLHRLKIHLEYLLAYMSVHNFINLIPYRIYLIVIVTLGNSSGRDAVTQVARGAQRWRMGTQSNWTQSEERSERGALVQGGCLSEFCAQRHPNLKERRICCGGGIYNKCGGGIYNTTKQKGGQ
jgi:hypothetical protein